MISEDILIRMANAGEVLNISNPVYMQALSVSSAPRKLDKPPKPIKLRKIDIECSYGCTNEFVMMYGQYRQSQNLDVAKIQVGQSTRICDPEVYYALHCLALSSVHCIPDRAAAAAELFKLLMTTPCDTLTVKRVYERLNEIKKPNYYIKAFIQGLRVCLFGGNAVMLYWMTLASDHAYYNNASKLGAQLISEKGWSESELKKFLNEQWPLAKADTDFYNQLEKSLCNKWMTAMIYVLKDKHPEALEHTSSEGFL